MERQRVVHATVLEVDDFAVVEKRAVRGVEAGEARLHEGECLLVLQRGVENLAVKRGVQEHLHLQNHALGPEVFELFV